MIARMLVAFAGLTFGVHLAMAEGLQSRYQEEVRYLLDFLGTSKCQFYRNGEWHDSVKAREHLGKKYKYLVKKSLIHSTEEFIALGASESSSSGEAYKVRCGSQAEVPSGQWLSTELARYRSRGER